MRRKFSRGRNLHCGWHTAIYTQFTPEVLYETHSLLDRSAVGCHVLRPGWER